MTDTFLIGVPADDAAELHELLASLDLDDKPIQQRYFDGSTFSEVGMVISGLLSAGGAGLALRAWIQARAEVRKATRITTSTFEMTAVSPAEAERLIRLLESHMGNEEQNELLSRPVDDGS